MTSYNKTVLYKLLSIIGHKSHYSSVFLKVKGYKVGSSSLAFVPISGTSEATWRAASCPSTLLQELQIQRFILPGGPGDVKSLKSPFLRRFTHALAEIGIFNQAQNCLGQCLGIAGRHQNPGHPILYQFRDTPHGSGNYRLAGCHCFGYNYAACRLPLLRL